MPSLVIKTLPAELHTRLKKSAEAHHRSMIREAVAILEASLVPEKSSPIENFLADPVRLKGALKNGETSGLIRKLRDRR